MPCACTVHNHNVLFDSSPFLPPDLALLPGTPCLQVALSHLLPLPKTLVSALTHVPPTAPTSSSAVTFPACTDSLQHSMQLYGSAAVQIAV